MLHEIIHSVAVEPAVYSELVLTGIAAWFGLNYFFPKEKSND